MLSLCGCSLLAPYGCGFSFSSVSPNYILSDFLVESAALRKQLEQETCRYEYEQQSSLLATPPPTKHQLISCLATRGQWVTRQPNLQLDPPESQQLLIKGASVHFLFEAGWTLSGAHQGDYLLMLKNIVSRIEAGTLKYVCQDLYFYWSVSVSMDGCGFMINTVEIIKTPEVPTNLHPQMFLCMLYSTSPPY